jgi:thiol-disulfide isomerase/thioredoxin
MTRLVRLLAVAAAGVTIAAGNPAAAATVDPKPFQALAAGPSLAGATGWLNSPPLTLEGLRGKVVLVDFWTYSCINCLRTLPYVRAWSRTYARQGLVVIGVHAPEFDFEHDPRRVTKALRDQHIDWPVAIDDDFAIWRSFRNAAWPALYFIDAQGRVRHRQLGEGGYDASERVIRDLLAQAHGDAKALPSAAAVQARGIGQAPDLAQVRSPETYLGYAHADDAAAPALSRDQPRRYAPATPRLNAWSLGGDWTQRSEYVETTAPGGALALRFHARDLHLVLGSDGQRVPFRITIDGHAPGRDHGVDVDDQGHGEIAGERLYQLVRQQDAGADHTFEIRFDKPGARAWVFTFG